MPVLYMREPLCCIISGGPGGINLAVMAAPCEWRAPPPKLGKGAAELLQQLHRPQSLREMIGSLYTKTAENRLRAQLDVLRSHGLVEHIQGAAAWRISAEGRRWLASPGGRTVDRSPRAGRQ